MKKKSVVVLLLLATLLVLSACSRFLGPSEDEAVKAIESSGLLKGLTVTSPIVVVEKGKKEADGSWPFKVKLTVTFKLPSGEESQPLTTVPTYFISRGKDSAGRGVWTARLAQ